MDLNFLKKIKLKNLLLIQHLEEGVIHCDLLVIDINETLPYTYHTVDLTNFYEQRKINLSDDIQELKIIGNNIDNQIYKLCEHDFIKDIIETTSEKTICVEYCVNCKLNKKNT
jgi:hypothetical protein